MSAGYKKVDLHQDGKKRSIKIHQLLAIVFLSHTPNGLQGLVVDHINGDKLDNSLDNLQLITQRLNSTKDRKRGTSKYIGVQWSEPRKKWKTTMIVNGKSKFLGRFKCELRAAVAYNQALKAL